VLERLYEAELDHLHELEEKYHAHLDRAVIDLAPQEQALLAGWLFRDLPLDGDIRDLYTAAVEMERRTRDHFRHAAAGCPPGLDRDLYLELASEEEEHIAMLETELEQL
jgi:rubrerythrin